jgi:uncharacterized protein (TIGR01777 family)
MRDEGERVSERRVAMTGASGLIGRALKSALELGGSRVLPLVRREAGPGEAAWDLEAGTVDLSALEGSDAVVHLAGDNLGEGRWTPDKKARILNSRVRGTEVLCEGLARMRRPPSVLVAASAIGWYGDGGDREQDEASPAGEGFLPRVCAAWEAATRPAVEAGIRVVNLRIGVVLASGGGALPKMLAPYRFGMGGPVGGGRQYVSWIALPDLVDAVDWCLGHDALSGPVNATAPGAVRQGDFARTLGRVLRRPAVVPLPAWVVRLAMGDKGEALLLEGARISPTRLLASGFSFRYPDLKGALRALLRPGSGP